MEQTQPIIGTGQISQPVPQTFLLASPCYSSCEGRLSALKTLTCESVYPDTCFTDLLLQIGVSLDAVIAFSSCDTWWLEPNGSLVTSPTRRSGWTIHAARKFLALYEIPSIILYCDGCDNFLINVGIKSQKEFQKILLGQKAFYLKDGHWSIGGYPLDARYYRPLSDMQLFIGGFSKKKKEKAKELPNYGWEGENPKDDRSVYVEKQSRKKRKEFVKNLRRHKDFIPGKGKPKYYAAANDGQPTPPPDPLGIAADVTSLIVTVQAYVRTKDRYVLAAGLLQMFSFVRGNADYMQLVLQNLPGLTEFTYAAFIEWLSKQSIGFAEKTQDILDRITPTFLKADKKAPELDEFDWVRLSEKSSADAEELMEALEQPYGAASMIDDLREFTLSDLGKLLSKFFSASVLALMAKAIKSSLDITVAQQLIVSMARDCDFLDMLISIAKKGLDFMARLFPNRFQAHIRHMENHLEYANLRKKVEQSMDAEPIVVYQRDYFPYRDGGLPQLIADYERYRELSAILGKPLVRHFESKFAAFNYFNSGNESRPLPFGVALVGPPGVGKTTMINDIWRISAHVWNLKTTESTTIGTDSKFDDPYSGGPHVLLDDFGVSKPERVADDPFNRIIRIMQTLRNFSEQAEAHNKGKVPWNVKTLCVTSNIDRLGVHNYVNNPIAILRRLHIYLEVLPKDPSKYTFDFKNVSEKYFEEAFTYVFKTVAPEFNTDQPLSNPVRNEMQTVVAFDKRSDALRYLMQRMQEHVQLQSKEKIAFAPLCLECFKRPCDCGAEVQKDSIVDIPVVPVREEVLGVPPVEKKEVLGVHPVFGPRVRKYGHEEVKDGSVVIDSFPPVLAGDGVLEIPGVPAVIVPAEDIAKVPDDRPIDEPIEAVIDDPAGKLANELLARMDVESRDQRVNSEVVEVVERLADEVELLCMVEKEVDLFKEKLRFDMKFPQVDRPRRASISAVSKGTSYYAVTKVVRSSANFVPFLVLFSSLTACFCWQAIWIIVCAVGEALSWWNFFPLYVLFSFFIFVLCFTDVFGCDEESQMSTFTFWLLRLRIYIGTISLRRAAPVPPAPVEGARREVIRRRAMRYIVSMVWLGVTSQVRIAYYQVRLFCLTRWINIRRRRDIDRHNSNLSILLATIAGVTTIGAVAGYMMHKSKKSDGTAEKVIDNSRWGEFQMNIPQEKVEKETSKWGAFAPCARDTGVTSHGLQRSRKRQVIVKFCGHANYGYFIDSNRVLTVAHLFFHGDETKNVEVEFLKKGEPQYVQSVPFSSVEVFKDKDFAVITVPDNQNRFASMFNKSFASDRPPSTGENYYYYNPGKSDGVVKYLGTTNDLGYVDSHGEKIQPPIIHVFKTNDMENKMEYGDCGTMIVDSRGLNVGIVVAASHNCSNFLVIPYPSLAIRVVETPVVEPQVDRTITGSVSFDAVTARPFGASIKIGEVHGVMVTTRQSEAKRSLLAGLNLDVNGEIPDPDIFGPPSIFRLGSGVRKGVYDTYHRNLDILKSAKAEVDPIALHKAIEDYWERILLCLSDEDIEHIHPESYFNALTGRENGKPTGIVRPVKLSTAVGYPFPSGKKEDHIRFTESEVVFSAPFGSFLEKFEQMLLNGVTPFTFCKASPKDEVTKLTKMKTRLFYVGDSATYCVIRKYFWWFPMLVYKHPLEFECAYGINPYSQEWADLQEHLNENPHHMAADFSDWDLRLPKEFLEGAFKIMERLSGLGRDSPSFEFFRALEPLFTSPVALFGTGLYNLEQGTVSGHPLTYLFNSIANSIRARYCFYTLFPERKFSDHVRAIYGGDDAHETTNLPEFNQLTTLPIMMKLGIRPTDSNKNTINTDFSPKEEVTFLKRDEKGRLDLKSIHKMLMWTTSNLAVEHASGAIASALYEMHLYGRDAFDAFVQSLRKELPRVVELNPANGMDLSFILREKASFLDFDSEHYTFKSTLADRIPEVHFEKRSLEFLFEE